MDTTDGSAVVERLRHGGVLVRGYRVAARNLVPLAMPGLVVFVPLDALALLVTVPLTGTVTVANDKIAAVGEPGTGLLTWWAAMLVLWAAAQAVVLAATMIVAAGTQAGVTVAPGAALRAAVRRWPGLLVLGLIILAAFLAVVATGAGVMAAVIWDVMAYAAMALLGLSALPLLLAGPVLILEGRSPLRAIGRAYVLAVEGTWGDLAALATGVLILPALVVRGTAWLLPLVPDPLAALAIGVSWAALALLVVPFQAGVLTRMYLQRVAWRWAGPPGAGVERLVAALPESPPPAADPRRPARLVLAAILLPGLLYGAIAHLNPFGWLELRQENASRSWRLYTPPEGRAVGPRAAYLEDSMRLVLLMEGWQQPSEQVTCPDPACAQTRIAVVEPAYGNPWPVTAGTRLPDGRLVLTTWNLMGSVPADARLGLLICDGKGCVRAPDGEPTSQVPLGWEGSAVAVAARQDGGVVVAHAREIPRKTSIVSDAERVTFTLCADPGCPRPVTKEVARLPVSAYLSSEGGIALAVTPGGRPVAAQVDTMTGQIYVISCQDLACDRPQVHRPARGTPQSQDTGLPKVGLSMAMRPDGRPVIAYQDVNDGALTLLDCRTPGCDRGDTVRLAAAYGPPALVLDRAGRALVAYQDESGRRIAVARCSGTRCGTVAVSRMRNGPGERLAMTLDGRGRPVIAWIDNAADGWALMVTTVLNLDAFAPGEG